MSVLHELSRSISAKGQYSLVRRDGLRVVTSAIGPLDPTSASGFSHVGRIGDDLDPVSARMAAAQCARCLLAALLQELGTLDDIAMVVSLHGYLATAADFVDHPTVMDGASAVLIEFLGDRGRHTRTTIGVHSLPFGLPLVVELSARLVDRPHTSPAP
jgi:enamine deaminase RidA (YjgF/YER057c/UK114 family)